MNTQIDNIEPQEDINNSSLVDWANPPVLMDLKQEFEDARIETEKHVSKVKVWLDNLNVEGSAKPKTRKGKSSIQPKLIKKQAEWRYPSLSEPFLSTPDVFNVRPKGASDRKTAQQNQLVLNHQFNNEIDKVSFIDELVRACVDEGSAIVRVGWEFTEKTITKTKPIYELQPINDPAKLAEIRIAIDLAKNKPQDFAQYIKPELQQAVLQTVQTGTPVYPVLIGEEEYEEVVTLSNRPTVKICDYRAITIDPTCEGDLSKAGFITETFTSSKAELMADGKYTNLDKIKLENDTVLDSPDEELNNESNFNFKDDVRKKFTVYEHWSFSDIHNTGELVPIVTSWVGNVIIRMEENPYPDQQLPYVSIPYLPTKKAIYGEPDGELTSDNQKVVGAVTRAMVDTMARGAAGQTGIRRDFLDLTNRHKFLAGEDYEFNGNVDPRVGVYMHQFSEIPNSALTMLNVQNTEAESLTGVKVFNDGISGSSLGDVAAGVRGALSAASKRETSILRRVASGVTKIGRKIISMNSEFLQDEEIIRITDDELVTIKRDELAGEFDLELSISTAEEDDNKAQQISFMLQTTGNNIDPNLHKMLLSDWARLRKMPDLAKQIETYTPEPDPLQEKIKQLEIAKLEAEIAQIRGKAIEHSTDAELNKAKTNTEYAKAENINSDTDKKSLDFVEQESGVKQERELQKQGAQAKGNQALELTKHLLNANQ